ncbi:hypothetical protein ACIBG8_33690 [Nonomuraea sp. NPDC050556]|uniref:hypothetical protein n=1 Tax=Nonomuraea sp. NPDC050556 TaxID=3364369 RepID=UPI00378759D0
MVRRVMCFVAGVVALLALSGGLLVAVSAFGAALPQQNRTANSCDPPLKSYCLWLDPFSSQPVFGRKADVSIVENEQGLFQATAKLVLLASDPVVAKVRSGAAIKDPGTFVSNVVGYVSVSRSAMLWTPPALESSGTTGSVTITTSGAENGTARGPRNVQLVLLGPGTVELKTRSLIVAGLTGSDLPVTSQTATSVKATSAGGGRIEVDLEPADPSAVTAAPERWVPYYLDSLWVPLLGAFSWTVVFLAGRFGRLGRLGADPSWQRAQWAIGAVLLAHLLLGAASAALPFDLLFSFAPISEAISEAGLWRPMGYAQGYGALVLLVSIVVCGALPWSTRAPSHPVRRSLLVVVCLGATLGGMEFLLTHAVAPGGAGAWRPAALGVVLMALAVFVLLGFLITWVLGALRRALLPRSGSPRWGQAVAGVLALAGGLAGVVALVADGWSGNPAELAGSWPALVVILVVLGFCPVMVATPLRELRDWPLSRWSPWESIACLAGTAALALRTMLAEPGAAPAELRGTVLGALVVLLIYAAVVLSRRWRGRGYRIVQLAALLPVLPVLVALVGEDARLGAGLNWLVLLVTGALAGLAVTRLAHTAITGTSLGGRACALLAVPAVLVAVPWGRLSVDEVSFWGAYTYLVRVDWLLGLVLVAVAVRALRNLGSAPLDAAALRDHRVLGLLAWFLALSDGYMLVGAPLPLVLGTSALGAWVLMPADQVHRAAHILAQLPAVRNRAVTWALRAGAARRVLPSLSKSVRDRTASTDLAFDDGQRMIEQLEAQAVDVPARIKGAVTVSTYQRAFGALDSQVPWRRAVWGLATGTVIGLPWVVLGLVGADRLALSDDPYPVLVAITSIAPLVLTWSAYGLLFGYFYPLLRGASGLAKSRWLFFAAILPGLVGAIVNGTGGDWRGLLLNAAQLFAFTMTLGMLADRRVLAAHGHRTARLVDVHNLWSLSAWASSVTVAVATGVVTILLAGLQPFVMGIIHPATAPTPPAAVEGPR